MKDDPAREDRLAAALRANLARRKARAREADAPGTVTMPPPRAKEDRES